ncbi:TPM domain-containing protein [Lactococcus taiwanensis]|uniref:TPM domain-containing protein n=1 Tax=Lactococcus taiwanensis TaxID=1151742 RepID=UPI0007B22B1C|nr:hypothetical protein P7266_1443 [Lactococcus cremoris]
MKKKSILFSLILFGLFFLFIPQPTKAATFSSGIEDNAQILGPTISSLQGQAQALADQTKAGVYVLTSNSTTSASSMARSYLAEQVGEGKNGVVLVINMNLRKVYIWATGNMKHYLSASRIEDTLDVVQPALSANDSSGAVTGFFDKVSQYYRAGIPTSRRYTVDEQTGAVTFQRSFRPLYIIIAALFALLSAALFIWMIYRRYQMKDAHAIWRYDYNHNGELQLSEREDRLVNTFITTRHIPRPSSDGGGSSGGSGGGRSF